MLWRHDANVIMSKLEGWKWISAAFQCSFDVFIKRLQYTHIGILLHPSSFSHVVAMVRVMVCADEQARGSGTENLSTFMHRTQPHSPATSPPPRFDFSLMRVSLFPQLRLMVRGTLSRWNDGAGRRCDRFGCRWL
jgi:hypothetical protein